MKNFFLILLTSIATYILNAQEVTTRIQNDWGNGRIFEVVITPTTNISSWTITLNLNNSGNTITNIWNATYTFQNNKIVLIPTTSTSAINSGATVVVGFQINGSGIPTYASHTLVPVGTPVSTQYWNFASGSIFTNPQLVTGNVGIGLAQGETPSYKLTVKRGAIGVLDTSTYPEYASLSYNELRLGYAVPAPSNYTSIRRGEITVSSPTNGSLTLAPHSLKTNILGGGSSELNGSLLTLESNYGTVLPIANYSSGSIYLSAKERYSPSITIDRDKISMSANVPAPSPYTTIERGKFSIGSGATGYIDMDIDKINIGIVGGGSAELTGGSLKISNFFGDETVVGGSGITTKSLTVDGKIEAEEIEVKNIGADFVFADDYKLRSLSEVEAYVKANKHLPEIAPASETEKGVNIGEFQEKLLQKVEELTLYIIELQKKNVELESKVASISNTNAK